MSGLTRHEVLSSWARLEERGARPQPGDEEMVRQAARAWCDQQPASDQQIDVAASWLGLPTNFLAMSGVIRDIWRACERFHGIGAPTAPKMPANVAPDGFMYFCPNCDSGGTIHLEDIMVHARINRHGKPELRQWPAAEQPTYRTGERDSP